MVQWDALEQYITHKRLAVLVALLALIPSLVFIPLPMTIGTRTLDFYDEIEALPQGSVVAFGNQYDATTYVTKRDAYRAVIYHLAEKGAKILFYGWRPTSPQLWINEMLYANCEDQYGWVYGENYVIFPFLAGEEAALSAVASNLRLFDTDVFGNQVANLPIMQDLYTMDDISMTLNDCSFAFTDIWVRQWPVVYGNRALHLGAFHTIAAYYGVYVHGDLDLVRGYAEYEYLTGFNGEELIKLQARNLNGLAILVLVAIANIGWLSVRFKPKIENEEIGRM